MADHIYSISEIVGSSAVSVDDAIKGALARAAKTLHNLDWFEVTNIRGHIEDNQLSHFQVTLTFWSGTTEATAGLAASAAASAGDTVAANDATALYPITWVPPAALTCEISGDSADVALPDWLLRMTMTGDADLAAPAGGDVAEVAALAVAAPVKAHARDAPAAMPMTCLDLLMVPSAAERPRRRRTRNQKHSTGSPRKVSRPHR